MTPHLARLQGMRLVSCLALATLLLGGCPGANKGAKVIDPPPPPAYEYLVKSGDTLYSIAWRHEMRFVELARINNIPHPYTIYPGQVLKVARPELVKRTPVRKSQPSTTSATRNTERPAPVAKTTGKTPASAPARRASAGWYWPTPGKISKAFGGDNKGVDFELGAGSEVHAAGVGTVIYSGSGIGGYSRLIIIRHNTRYMSAYSLDLGVLVKEGQTVSAGQVIARAGGVSSRGLHFEIRDRGKPIDPIRVLKGS